MDDDRLNDEEYDHDYGQSPYYKAYWPDMINKRYASKFIDMNGRHGNGGGGETRLWAIPYRFGKRAAMPYRFGKRAGMHFRLG